MTREETLVIMSILKTAYPSYYRDMKKTEADKTVDLWAAMLEPYPAEICAFAVKRLIAECKFAPTISEVIDRIKECLQIEGDDASAMWNLLYDSASKATILTRDEFDALPYEIQRFCGSLAGLIELGNLKSDILSTVTRGQFMKTYEILKRRRETMELMTPEMLSLVQNISAKTAMPGKMTPQQLSNKPADKQLPSPSPQTLTSDDPENSEPFPFDDLPDDLKAQIAPYAGMIPGVKPISAPSYQPLSDEEWIKSRDEQLAKLEALKRNSM